MASDQQPAYQTLVSRPNVEDAPFTGREARPDPSAMLIWNHAFSGMSPNVLIDPFPAQAQPQPL